MRPQILAAALAVLLVAVFLAAWGFTLPGAPAVPFTPGARAAPTATPPASSAAPTPIASRPRPTPAPTPAPAPAPTPTLTPMPTPTLRPTPTPAPTSPPTPQPTLTPTPAPEAFFLEVHSPDNYAEVSGKPEVRVSASTLPWLISEIRYHSGSGLEQYRIVRADGNGNFSDQVPLAEGFNAIEIITYHGASEQKKRRSLAVIYDPEPVAPAPIALFLNISEPKDGATVSNRVLTVAGATAPDAEVVLNGIIPAAPDELGEWQASIVLRPGENEISARAVRGKESVADAITVTYDPGS